MVTTNIRTPESIFSPQARTLKRPVEAEDLGTASILNPSDILRKVLNFKNKATKFRTRLLEMDEGQRVQQDELNAIDNSLRAKELEHIDREIKLREDRIRAIDEALRRQLLFDAPNNMGQPVKPGPQLPDDVLRGSRGIEPTPQPQGEPGPIAPSDTQQFGPQEWWNSYRSGNPLVDNLYQGARVELGIIKNLFRPLIRPLMKTQIPKIPDRLRQLFEPNK